MISWIHGGISFGFNFKGYGRQGAGVLGLSKFQNAFLLRFKKLTENGCNDGSVNSLIVSLR
jgi:hypothetical protein